MESKSGLGVPKSILNDVTLYTHIQSNGLKFKMSCEVVGILEISEVKGTNILHLLLSWMEFTYLLTYGLNILLLLFNVLVRNRNSSILRSISLRYRPDRLSLYYPQ